MLISLIPLFDENMAVKAYSVFLQKTNQFLNPLAMLTGVNDGATTLNDPPQMVHRSTNIGSNKK